MNDKDQLMQARNGLVENILGLTMNEMELQGALKKVQDKRVMLMDELVGVTQQLNKLLEEEAKSEKKEGAE